MYDPTLEYLNSFTVDDIPDLDIVVLGALILCKKSTLPELHIDGYKQLLVVGSGNAEATGRILFEKTNALFATESSYENKLTSVPSIDGVVVISASGGKHAPVIVKKAKELGKRVILITDTKESHASQLLNKGVGDLEYVFPKNREPYTYNTSTYLSMILGHTREDAEKIESFIKETIDIMDLSRLGSFDRYYCIVPSKFSLVTRMLQTKFTELFGRMIARDVETYETTKHATTVVKSSELFISFGEENALFGDKSRRLFIPLPEWADYGTMIAIAYYVIGKIQATHHPYFKESIVAYTEEISKVFGETISPIIE